MSIDDLIDNFAFFDCWEDKYQYVIDLGRQLEPLEDEYKCEQWKIKGCQSQVWLVPQFNDSHILVKGIIAIVLLIYNDKTKDEIKRIDIAQIFAKLGLEENLTPSRRNGMMSMVAKIKEYADMI